MRDPHLIIVRRANWLRLHSHRLFDLSFPRFRLEYAPLHLDLAGYHDSGTELIVLNLWHSIRRTKWAAHDLITHEFAHLVTDRLDAHVPPHGRLFKEVCRALGSEPYVMHDVDVF